MPQNYILPPPVGISNSLYEAFPASPNSPSFAISPATGGPGIQPPGFTTNLNGSTLSNGIQGTTISGALGVGDALPNSTITTPSSNPQNTTAATPSLSPGSLADYFARAIIIVLGFIFIAVGLNMLRPGTVPNVIGRRH